MNRGGGREKVHLEFQKDVWFYPHTPSLIIERDFLSNGFAKSCLDKCFHSVLWASWDVLEPTQPAFFPPQAFLHPCLAKDPWPQTSSTASICVLWKNSAEELRKQFIAGSWKVSFTDGRGPCVLSTLTSRDLRAVREPTAAPGLIHPSLETPAPTVAEKELIYVKDVAYPKQPWAVYSKYRTLVRFPWSLFSQTPLQLLLACFHSCASATWKPQMQPLSLFCIPETTIIFTMAMRAFLLSTQLTLQWDPERAKCGTRALSQRSVELWPKLLVWFCMEAPTLATWDRVLLLFSR